MTIRKKYIIIITCLLAICVAGGAYAFAHHSKQADSYATSGNARNKNTTQKTTSLNADEQTQGSDSTSTSSGSVAIGSVDQPANDADYPIVNDHYRIDKSGDKAFNIALYAIINSPSQHDEYIQQLKQYKQEALAYLTSRYGSTSQFVINWDPPTAKDL